MTLIRDHPRTFTMWLSLLSLGGFLQWLGV